MREEEEGGRRRSEEVQQKDKSPTWQCGKNECFEGCCDAGDAIDG